MTVVEITLGARMPREDGAVHLPSAQARGIAMTDQLLTGVLVLAPERGAAATIAQVLALPELANDTIVIVGDANASRGKRRIYREMFSLLGRVQRPVLWIPGPVDNAFAGDVRERVRAGDAPDCRATRGEPAAGRGHGHARERDPRRAHPVVQASPGSPPPAPRGVRGG